MGSSRNCPKESIRDSLIALNTDHTSHRSSVCATATTEGTLLARAVRSSPATPALRECIPLPPDQYYSASDLSPRRDQDLKFGGFSSIASNTSALTVQKQSQCHRPYKAPDSSRARRSRIRLECVVKRFVGS